MMPHAAAAWGIKHELRSTRSWKASLTFKAITRNAITYCLDIAPDFTARFPPAELAFETDAALQLWTIPLRPPHGGRIRIQQVACHGAVDLHVVIGPRQPGDNANGAYAQTMRAPDPAEDYILIKIDTDYIWHETRGVAGNANGNYGWQTTMQALGITALAQLAPTLDAISITPPRSVDAVAQALHLPHSTVFWTTYRALIHELGHGFGLCDTNQELLEQDCDPLWRSQGAQPSSVMADANYFYLTADDQAGIMYLQKMQPH
jgi:hypothetical protein